MKNVNEDVQTESTFLRQWRIVRSMAITGVGKTLRELATEFGVVPLTIRRDFEVIQSVFGPFRTVRETHGELRYFFDSQSFFLTKKLTQNEVVALEIAKKMMQPLQNTSFAADYDSAATKIFVNLPSELMSFAKRAAESFMVHRVGAFEEHCGNAILNRIFQAIVDHRVLSIVYRSVRSTRIKRYHIHPYCIVFTQEQLYLLGWSCVYQDIRPWKISRFHSVNVLRKNFEPIEKADLESRLGCDPVFGMKSRFRARATVLFDKEMRSEMKESCLKMIQKKTFLKNGQVLVEVEYDRKMNFFRWLRGYGRFVTLVGPTALRREFEKELQETLRKYRR